MISNKTISQLKAMKDAVLADGKVDLEETDQLLKTLHPLAKKYGFAFEDYEILLKKCREDGQITKEESAKLAEELDYLCGLLGSFRMRFWLVVAVVTLLAAASLAVAIRVQTVVSRSARTTEVRSVE